MGLYVRVVFRSRAFDDALRRLSFEFDVVWRRGEPTSLKSNPKHRDSGAQLCLNSDSGDLAFLQRRAKWFLRKFGRDVRKLADMPVTRSVVLDFGLGRPPDSVMWFRRLDAELIQLAAAAGCAIEISEYPWS